MIKIASVSVILFGLYTLQQGYYYIKYPQKSVVQCCEFDPDDK
jgi:hypothetical protein